MTRVWRDRHTIGANTSHFCREIAGSVDREGGGSKSPSLLLGGGRGSGLAGRDAGR
jgi:hypothetical protein